MNIAFVGCGFVFDIYMRTVRAHPEIKICGVYDINTERSALVNLYYGYKVYKSFEELLQDKTIDIVVNLTNIGSHFEVSKLALEEGKNVYSEKPLAKSTDECQELFNLAAEKKLCFYGAPSNIYSDSVRTIFKAVEDGAIGRPLLVYAELDDNPIQLMDFEKVKSASGAPWPLDEEIREGCTYEHVGYHLVWICALLGPAVSVTAFSSELLDNKSKKLKGKIGTPDYSVACLHFESGATARITCSVVAPRDHRMRVIGDQGEVHSDSYRHYQSPVYLERFSKTSLSARKFSTLRKHRTFGRLFGVGGRKLKPVRHWKSAATESDNQLRSSAKQRVIEWVRRREVYSQDKFIGIAEMAQSIARKEDPYLSPKFLMHINELTLIIQNAGTSGVATKPSTGFEPLGSITGALDAEEDYLVNYCKRPLERLFSK